MKLNFIAIASFVLLFQNDFFGQINFSANEIVRPYEEDFGYGANMGAYPPWRDENLANIAAGNPELGLRGMGITTFRPELPELFVEYWGYDIRVEAFEHYTHLGMKDHVLFIGQPSPQHRDSTFYCDTEMSKLFKNMYLPIWDDGTDGTPVNDSNYFARYVYRLAYYYGDHVRFWEVWNEPDLDIGGHAPLEPGQPGNWWENNPPACDVQIFAPIFHYIRLLRITYEVVKSLHPEDYVAVGGLGNPSYLDAILRNTDNPDEGAVSVDFPLKGGAYFDCMSFHSYPHLDGSLQSWSNDIMNFVYKRHSDAALDGLLKRRQAMENVLTKWGYDGNEFPEKVWILTETNIPRKSFTPGFIGTAEAQRNFILKSLIAVQQHNIHQFHVYSLADVEPESVAKYEFEVMGLVKNLTGTDPHAHEITELGIAYRTCSQMLRGWKYDPALTETLELPETIRGGAFKNDTGDINFVLWAVTQIDSTDAAYAEYSFPKSLNIKSLKSYRWDYSEHVYTLPVHPDSVALSGDPVFLRPEFVSSESEIDYPGFAVRCYPNPAADRIWVDVAATEKMSLSGQIFTPQGQLVRSIFDKKTVQNGFQKLEISRDGLPDGLYFLVLSSGKSRVREKIVFY